MKKYLSFFIVLWVNQVALAEGIMQPLKTDPRAKIVTFDANQIYSLKTHYLISTDIMVGPDEIINANDVHLGDASSWDVQANGHHLYIKAKKINASGNLNFTTNLYTYHFVLSVADAMIRPTDQTLFLKFIYPNHGPDEKKLALEMISLPPDICRNPLKYNLQYSYTGDSEQAPVYACDDGIFTYFQFRRPIDLPAIFMVLSDQREEVVNYRMEGHYVVVERVAKAFTLRNGDTVTSVYNDKYLCDWNKVKK